MVLLSLIALGASLQLANHVVIAVQPERMAGRVVSLGGRHLVLGGFDYPTRTTRREIASLGDDGRQTDLPDRLAVGRNHFEAAALGESTLLVVGGYSESYETLAEIESVDFRTHRVEAWGWLPRAVELFTMEKWGDKFAVVGGLTSQDPTRTSDLIQIIDPKTKQTFLSKAHLRISRFGHGSVWLDDGQLLIAGGKHVSQAAGKKATYHPEQSTELWDPGKGTVRDGGMMTMPRDRPGLCKLPGGHVLIIGGATDKGLTDTIEEYDPDTGRSRVIAHMSCPRMAVMTLRYKDQGLLIAGGWCDDAKNGPNIEFLNFKTLAVTTIGRAAVCRAEGQMVWLSKDVLVLVGGKNVPLLPNPHSESFGLTETFRVLDQRVADDNR